MSVTHYNTDDINVQRTGNQDLKATTAGASVVLPYMDNNEINKKLEEHSKLLKEWEDLLNRTATPDVHSISPADAQRHIFLKRKLHESLGIMARIVQNQIKLKKTGTDVQTINAHPVMVNAPGSGNYAPVTTATIGTTAPSGMLLSSINYAPDGQQPVTGMTYANPYSYQNGYLTAMPVQTTAVDGVPQYYNYAPNMNNQTTTQPGQIQPIQSQMYVPQYQMTANNPNTQTTTNGTGAGGGTAYNTMNYAPTYAQTGVTYATPQPVVLQPTAAMQSYNTTNVSNNGNNSNLPKSQSQQVAQNPQGYTAYYTTTPSGDGSTMMYSQQMLSQVPMSYYGNSSVAPSSTTTDGVAAPAAMPQSQPQYVLPPQQQQQSGMQSGMSSGVQSGMQSGMSSGVQSGMQSGVPHERYLNSTAGNMQPNMSNNNSNHTHSASNMNSYQQQQLQQQQQHQKQ